MLVPPIFEQFGYLSPFLSLAADVAYQDVVLLQLPLLLRLRGVQVVEPSLPALFGRPEISPFRLNVQFLGQLTPLVFLSSPSTSKKNYSTNLAKISSSSGAHFLVFVFSFKRLKA